MGSNAHKFTDEQAAEIREKYEDGGTVEKLAKEYGTTGSTISRTVRRAGGTVRTRDYRTYGFDPETSRIMRQKYEAGATLQDLVDQYGTYRTTISNAIKRAGGTMRPTGYEKGTHQRDRLTKGILSWLNS